MKRKTIAVCVTGYDQEYETRVVEGIAKKAQELDVNVTVFASLMRRPEFNSGRTLPASVLKGEASIFGLINYELADGVIILGDSIVDDKIIGKITEITDSTYNASVNAVIEPVIDLTELEDVFVITDFDEQDIADIDDDDTAQTD